MTFSFGNNQYTSFKVPVNAGQSSGTAQILTQGLTCWYTRLPKGHEKGCNEFGFWSTPDRMNHFTSNSKIRALSCVLIWFEGLHNIPSITGELTGSLPFSTNLNHKSLLTMLPNHLWWRVCEWKTWRRWLSNELHILLQSVFLKNYY